MVRFNHEGEEVGGGGGGGQGVQLLTGDSVGCELIKEGLI